MFFSNITIIYKGIKTKSAFINTLILETIIKLLGHYGEVEGTLKQDGIIVKSRCLLQHPLHLNCLPASCMAFSYCTLYKRHLVLLRRNRPLSIYINMYCSIPGTDSAH